MTPAAVCTLSLTGRYRRQGTEAAEALCLWAHQTGTRLDLIDDASYAQHAVAAYRARADTSAILIGPYGSDLVRAVAPVTRAVGQLLWNHGGSANDLAQPGVATVAAPASSYFDGTLDRIADAGITEVLLVQARGPFAQSVMDGARARAKALGIPTRTVAAPDLDEQDLHHAAVLTAGSFDHDVNVVRSLTRGQQGPALIAAVAAGITAFGDELGPAAEGVLGPVQWWPTNHQPDIGPTGEEFAAGYQERTGQQPSYTAAQAAAAAYLAVAWTESADDPHDPRGWKTSTLLGDFELDEQWQQTAHRPSTIRWRNRHMEPDSE